MNVKESKKAAAAMRSQIDAALADIIKRNDMVKSMKIKTIRYGEDGFRTTLECQWADGLTPDERMYEDLKGIFGLPERGTTFVSLGHAYTICGMKTKRRAEWVLAESTDKRVWLFRPDDVLRLLKTNPQIAEFKINL